MEDQVRGAQRGDPVAMSALLGELTPWVGRICGSIALDRGDDALQETMLVVFRNLVTLREPAALRAWVRRIAVRESLRLVTGRRDVPTIDFSSLEAPGRPDDEAIDSLDVRAALAEIPPGQRAVMVLRYLEDMSEEQTAEVLGIDQGTVKSRASRGRKALARRWVR